MFIYLFLNSLFFMLQIRKKSTLFIVLHEINEKFYQPCSTSSFIQAYLFIRDPRVSKLCIHSYLLVSNCKNKYFLLFVVAASKKSQRNHVTKSNELVCLLGVNGWKATPMSAKDRVRLDNSLAQISIFLLGLNNVKKMHVHDRFSDSIL